ncbi:MAG: hypothetical protein AB7O28_01560 [Vicinamibacterales bacterium]
MCAAIRLLTALLASTQVAGPLLGPPREAPAARLQRLIEALTGPAPASCGHFAIERFGEPAASADDLREGLACIGDHARGRRPAWFVVELQGIDSWVANGVLVDADGRIQSYSYDSDPSGGSGAPPRLTPSPCPRPLVETTPEAWASVRCDR